MIPQSNIQLSSVIISVYKDDVALRLILKSLLTQSVTNFEVIVSEDGESDEIKRCVDHFKSTDLFLLHLTQDDKGFRKNIALNRAIKASNTEHLIFIDGDCIPHPSFVEAHKSCTRRGITCTGRRLELGEAISDSLRTGKIGLTYLTNRMQYLLHCYALNKDNAKNIESGIFSTTLQTLTKDREIRILGCNFSSNKQDLIKINGFNEDYLAPGIGEDSDIDWRLLKSGVKIRNVKFSAIQYHLYHPRAYSTSTENIALFEKPRQTGSYICANGLQHDIR